AEQRAWLYTRRHCRPDSNGTTAGFNDGRRWSCAICTHLSAKTHVSRTTGIEIKSSPAPVFTLTSARGFQSHDPCRPRFFATPSAAAVVYLRRAGRPAGLLDGERGRLRTNRGHRRRGGKPGQRRRERRSRDTILFGTRNYLPGLREFKTRATCARPWSITSPRWACTFGARSWPGTSSTRRWSTAGKRCG